MDNHIDPANLIYIEKIYDQYLKDSSKVDPSWQSFLKGMEFGSLFKEEGKARQDEGELKVFRLLEAYRQFGHLAAHFNPVEVEPRNPEKIPQLSLEKMGFSEQDFTKDYPTSGFIEKNHALLSEILEQLRATYCRTIGFEYAETEPEIKFFIQKQIEPHFQTELSHKEQLALLHSLNQSEIFESFIQMKYPGQKRFSLEGGETLIPMMKELIDEGGEEGISVIILGMAHRGRLNVLANILGKSYSTIFQEFEGGYVPDSFEGMGDVKYHKGFAADLKTRHGKQVHISLAANPSHLESVDPVVEGQARAHQELHFKENTKAIVPILIHGDAAIAGQGVVYETMQLSKLEGYATGGTIHIVINNQVGFTASPGETKSTTYCTDLAKAFRAPVFHVNAEDPEGCKAIAKLAMRIRQRFQIDIFIELNCFRKYGHNETDEPAFTQPLVYQMIKEKKNIRDLYRDFLIEKGQLSKEEADDLEKEFRETLQEALEKTKEIIKEKREIKLPQGTHLEVLLKEVKTGVPFEKLKELAGRFCNIPEGFNIHPKLQRLFEDRLKMLEGSHDRPAIDWGMAEYLAYASLLTSGIHIRLSGQDSGRGTFSHRHGILTDQKTTKRYYPLSHLAEGQARFEVYNSPLSEYAVLGFEYGYSLVYEKSLILWEAQFGDFANGAQIVIDQYIVSAEQKWNDHSGLTLLLPHGYEGLGPEHSSARIERFLQLAAHNSIIVAVPSTASQFYHLLRRQAMGEQQKPLILFSPKALLRYPPSLSPIKDFVENTSFQEVIDDPKSPKKAKRIFFCTGKVYYNLLEEREKRNIQDVALIRIEQLYPLHEEKIKAVLEYYKGFEQVFWVQEEHENMGAWNFIEPRLQKLLPEKLCLRYVGRMRSASPAAGSSALHHFELAKFLNEAFDES